MRGYFFKTVEPSGMERSPFEHYQDAVSDVLGGMFAGLLAMVWVGTNRDEILLGLTLTALLILTATYVLVDWFPFKIEEWGTRIKRWRGTDEAEDRYIGPAS